MQDMTERPAPLARFRAQSRRPLVPDSDYTSAIHVVVGLRTFDFSELDRRERNLARQ